jgi:hypothetical protein
LGNNEGEKSCIKNFRIVCVECFKEITAEGRMDDQVKPDAAKVVGGVEIWVL